MSGNRCPTYSMKVTVMLADVWPKTRYLRPQSSLFWDEIHSHTLWRIVPYVLVFLNCFLVIRTLRKRRQAAMAPAPTTIVTKFKSCLSMTEKNEMSHVEDCMEDSHWDISCKMESSSCFYFVTCEKTETRYDWTCKEVHSSSANPSCCDYVCHVDKEK